MCRTSPWSRRVTRAVPSGRKASPQGKGNPVAMVFVAGAMGAGAVVAGAERGLAVEAGSEVLVNRGAAAVGNVTRSPPLVQLVVATATAISAVHQTRVFM